MAGYDGVTASRRTSLDEWVASWYDVRIQALQQHIDQATPYEPRVGDPDYLTPAQRQALRAPLDEEET